MGQQEEQRQRAQKLVGLLQANPELMEPVETLLSVLEGEKALGSKADEIEEQIIGQLRVLGRGSLQGWAQRASAAAQREAKGHAHAKKNSGG
jgi:hypothetical protein